MANYTARGYTSGVLRFFRGPQQRTPTIARENGELVGRGDRAILLREIPAPAGRVAEDDTRTEDHSGGEGSVQTERSHPAVTDDDECLLDRWFVALTVVLALNFATWSCASWLIFSIEDYVSDFRKYESGAIGIFVPVFLVTLFFILFIRFLRREKQQFFVWPIKFTGDQRFGWKYLLAFVNALLCSGGIFLYYGFARHEYFKPNWDANINYNESLYPPAFAFVSGYNDAAMANVLESYNQCSYPTYDKQYFCSGTAFNRTATKLPNSPYGDLDAHIFNSTLLNVSNQTYTELASTVVLQLATNYNSAEIQNRYQDRNLMSPYVFAVMYDTRVNLTDALRCGLLSLTEIPAMGSTTFTIFAETMTDRFGYVKPAASSDNQTCESFYTETLSMDPPYTFYTFNMASLPNTDLASCDVSNNSAAFCICQVLIRYGSRVVRGMESARGTTSLDIFIMEGAVVGGIQFFMWFFSLYVL